MTRAYKPRGAPWTHGTVGAYKSGCRCSACRHANAAYEKARRTRPRDVIDGIVVRYSATWRTRGAVR